MEEAYKSALTELKKKSHYGGPDYEVSFLALLYSKIACIPYLLSSADRNQEMPIICIIFHF